MPLGLKMSMSCKIPPPKKIKALKALMFFFRSSSECIKT